MIFQPMFWVVCAVAVGVVYLLIRVLFKPYGPKGNTPEEKLNHTLREMSYDASGEFVLFHSNMVHVVLTHKNVLALSRNNQEQITKRIIPVNTVERIEAMKDYVNKSFGTLWGNIILHEKSGNTSYIKLPNSEIDQFVTAWGGIEVEV